MPEQQPPAGFDPSGWRDPPAWNDPTAWHDPTAMPSSPPATPSDPWAPAIPQQRDCGEQPAFGQPAHGPMGYAQPTYGQPPAGWGGAGPAYGWPAAPPRRRTGPIIGIIAAVVVVVLGGLAAIGATPGGPDKGGATNTTSQTPAESPIAIGDGTALLGAIVTPSAAGHPQTISGTSHGVMTLDQLISQSFDNDSAEKGRLTDRGFAAAAQREWINSSNVQVDIQLIQFDDASGANEHVSNQVDAYGRDDKVTGSFDIAGVSGGKGFEKSDRDSYGNRSATLIAASGNVAVLMFVFTPHDFDRATEMSVMAQQVAALGA